MEDEVFVSMVPDLSCPPPGWGQNACNQQVSQSNFYHQQARGRGASTGSHPTRVIRRTDLRTRGGQGGGHRQQRPPRFSNLQEKNVAVSEDRRKSWGEEWKPEPVMVEEEEKKPINSNGLVDRLESKDGESNGEGEWKEVKGRRWTKTEETKKTSNRKSPDLYPPRKKTPEPHATTAKRRSPESRPSHRKSPEFHSSGKMSPEFPRPGKRDQYSANRKSPELNQRKASDSYMHEFPIQRKSPELSSHRKSPELSSHRKSPEIPYHKKSPEYNRRGSYSSNDGEKSLVFRNKRRSPTFEKRSHARASPPPRLQEKKPEYLITENGATENLVTENAPEDLIQNPPKMLLVSDLPDEQRVRSAPLVRQLTEFEIKIRQEEAQLKLQKEILSFLRQNWQEVANELKETENEWPPRVSYYTNHFLV